MRVLVAGDTHGDLAFAKELGVAANANDCEGIIQVGDWGYLWPRHKPERLTALSSILRSHGVWMDFIDGNHDWHERLRSEPAQLSDVVRYLRRGHRWEADGVSFLALGGAYSIDQIGATPYIDYWPEEELTYADCLNAIEGGPVDVVFTHDAPECPGPLTDFLAQTNDDWASAYGPRWHYDIHPRSITHRELINEVVKAVQPRVLIHGHYHYRYTTVWNGTKIIGLGQNGDGSNAWVVLDTAEFHHLGQERSDVP